MGVVYAARDRELEETVALKVLFRELVQSSETLVRFRKEVKLARRVTHRNVARTYDIGEHEGQRFLTMELVDGEPLSSLLDREAPLEIGRALDIARQMIEGMVAAHHAGVVHRDLKPENVSIAADGRVVLMDFGIARGAVSDDAWQTSGQTWGTPAYMAPEQVEASPDLDGRADQYAFGAVLYEMLTGRVAWSGTSPIVVAAARLQSPPPDPRGVRPELSPELGAFVMRCMAREPADRFEDGSAALRALDGVPRTETPPAAGVPRTSAARPAPVASSGTRGSSRPFGRRHGIDELRQDLADQLVLMGDTSPIYRSVIQLLDSLIVSAEGAALAAALQRVWQKRSFEGPYERPLLVLAALRADARAEGATHPLFDALAADAPSAAAVTKDALLASVAPSRIGFWITLRSRRIQTNEVSRGLVWLWPAMLAGAGGRARALQLFDIGASAGLNLVADGVDLSWRRVEGGALVLPRDLDVRGRVGLDPRPLDVRRKEDCEWLRSCIWPEQRARLARLDAAISAFHAARPAPELVLGRSSAAPARLEDASKQRTGELTIAYQTFVRGYVSPDERDACEKGMRDWLSRGARGARVWSTLELAETGRPEVSCALEVHVGVGGAVETVELCRTSYHPEVVEAISGAEERLLGLLLG